MLDIKYIKENPEEVIARLAKKGKDAKEEIAQILALDAERRALIAETESIKAEQNKMNKMIPVYKKEGKDVSAIFVEMKELSVRVKAMLRRCATHDTTVDDETVKFDNIEISRMKYELKINGSPVPVPPKELELLYFLASNCNHVFKRDQLLDKVWGFDYLGDSRTVDVHVKRLREKLEGVSDRWALKTVWGVGYKFETY